MFLKLEKKYKQAVIGRLTRKNEKSKSSEIFTNEIVFLQVYHSLIDLKIFSANISALFFKSKKMFKISYKKLFL